MRNGASRAGRWLAFGFLCLYVLTAQRGVSWQDSGVFQLRIAYCDLTGFFGAATDHPLYIRLGHAFSKLAEFAFGLEVPAAANLFSAICMALAVKVLFIVAFEITGSRRGAFLAAMTFGLAHMVWWLATIAETYALSVLFIGMETLYAIRVSKGDASTRSIMSVALFAGLGFATHNLSLLSLPFNFIVVVIAAVSGRGAAERTLLCRVLRAVWLSILFVTVWIVSSGLPARVGASDGATPLQIASGILLGDYGREVLGVSGVPFKVTIANFAIMAFSFLMPCWFVAVRKLARVSREHGLGIAIRGSCAPVRLVAALLVVHAIFLLHYRIADQALFLLPTLFFSSVLLAIMLKDVRMPVIFAAVTVFSGIAIPLAANAVLHLPPLQHRVVASRARILPFRDEIRYWALPWKHDERSAEQFAAAAIAKMDEKPGALLYADSTSAPPIMLRSGGASSDWSLYTQWNDVSRFIVGAEEGKAVFAVSPVRGYCPGKALSTGNVSPLF